MIRSTQRKMLRIIVQTKRKDKKKTQTSKNENDGMEKMKKRTTEAQMMKQQSVAVQTQIATKTVTSLMKDTDEEIDTAEIEEEEWIEYTKRSTATAIERMKVAQIAVMADFGQTDDFGQLWV